MVQAISSDSTARSRHTATDEQLADNLDNLIHGFDRTVDHIISVARHNVYYNHLPLEHSLREPVRSRLNELAMMRAQVQSLQSELQHAANMLVSAGHQMSQVESSYQNYSEEGGEGPPSLNLHLQPNSPTSDHFQCPEEIREPSRLSDMWDEDPIEFTIEGNFGFAELRSERLARIEQLRLLTSDGMLSGEGEDELRSASI